MNMGRSRKLTPKELRFYNEVQKAPIEYIDHPTLGRIATIDSRKIRKKLGYSDRFKF